MERKIITTGDGSASIFVPHLNEHYHSIHGAVQESAHVFIGMGLKPFLEGAKQKIVGEGPIEILGIGFGTGLNALMTFAEVAPMIGGGAGNAGNVGNAGNAITRASQNRIRYTAIEKYPVELEIRSQLAYPEALLRPDLNADFEKMHAEDWEEWQELHPRFHLRKMEGEIEAFEPGDTFHLVYFDAFAPEKQPELWTEAIFEKMYRLMKPGGSLVTYCAKGAVRRAMIAAGFEVEKLPGPPGKREMLRANRRLDK